MSHLVFIIALHIEISYFIFSANQMAAFSEEMHHWTEVIDKTSQLQVFFLFSLLQ